MPIQRVVVESQGQGLGYRATSGLSGATLTVGLPGPDGAPAPKAMELIAMGLGVCMGAVVSSILEKKRIAFSGVRVEVESDRAEEGAGEFRAMALKISVQSEELDQETLEKAIELAGKHCPAHATLSHGVPITATGEVR